MNEVPRIEVVVAGVAEHVPIELIRRDQVRLRADVARGRAGAGPEHRSGVVIETVLNAGAPEVEVRHRDGEVGRRPPADAPPRTHNVLPADAGGGSEEGGAGRVGLDALASPP